MGLAFEPTPHVIQVCFVSSVQNPGFRADDRRVGRMRRTVQANGRHRDESATNRPRPHRRTRRLCFSTQMADSHHSLRSQHKSGLNDGVAIRSLLMRSGYSDIRRICGSGDGKNGLRVRSASSGCTVIRDWDPLPESDIRVPIRRRQLHWQFDVEKRIRQRHFEVVLRTSRRSLLIIGQDTSRSDGVSRTATT